MESHHDNKPEPLAETPKPEVKKKSKVTRRIFGGIFVVIALCVAGYGGFYIAQQQLTPTSQFETVANDGNLTVTESEQNISSVVEKVGPSVVSIISDGETNRFGRVEQAAGTGIIVSKNGYVMTNKHVIAGASGVSVVTSSGVTYDDVKIVGSDPLNDLAYLKIAGVDDLTPAEMGDSKTLRTGQAVVAIGNALGQYQNTVTSGIISGLGRPVVAATDASGSDAENLNDLLQTDAAINSGNSGGPLINLQGQVIGINTAVASDAQSIGFAIPIGAAKGTLKTLLASGTVERAIVGVQYVSITPEVKAEYNLSVVQGDYITADSGAAVQAGGPGAKAGLKAKDIITKVNGVTIGPGKSISTLVGEFQPGNKVTLGVLRGDRTITLTVTLGSYSDLVNN